MRARYSIVSLLACTVLLSAPLSGCKKDKTGADSEGTSGAEANNNNAPEPVVSLSGDSLADECALQTVYFAYDSAELDSASRAEIQRAVECYRDKNATVRLRLVGATDPRGTEEYNIALGERRARAVRGYLVSLGVAADKLSVSSVGEEMASGTDESGWAEDRHVSPSSN